METSSGVVHIVEPDKAEPRGKRVLNRRSRFNIHLVSADIPKHSDYTVCGIKMKGRRWEITDRRPSCYNCLKGAKNEQ